jgi:hypothetical protein
LVPSWLNLVRSTRLAITRWFANGPGVCDMHRGGWRDRTGPDRTGPDQTGPDRVAGSPGAGGRAATAAPACGSLRVPNGLGPLPSPEASIRTRERKLHDREDFYTA